MSKLHLYDSKTFKAPLSFSELLESRSQNSKPFLIFYRRKRVLSWSFSDYARKVAGLKELLPELFRLPTGSTVMVTTGNSPETYLIYGALLAEGYTVAPVDPNEGKDFIKTVIEHAKVKAVVSLPSGLNGFEAHSISQYQFTYDEIKEEEFKVSSDRSPKTFFFTSGTTGAPKAVTQNFNALYSNLEGTRLMGEMSSEDTLFSCLPLFHVNAFNFSFLLPLLLESTIVYSDGFPLDFWKIVDSEGVTIGSLSPPVIRAINLDKRERPNLEKLRYFISASSALYRADIENFIERSPEIRICQAYGLSETVNFTLFTPPSISDEIYQLATKSEAIPSAGIEVIGNEVYVLDDSGVPIDREGVVGEICVRGWNVHEGYFGSPEADKSSFAGDYFHTGDAGYFKIIGKKKFFFLTGRIKECLKRLGKLIYLSEIDSAIREIGLTEACAVGFPSDQTEEEVGLYLVRQEGDPEAKVILRKLREKLSFAKCPKVVIEGEKIPRTSVGKIQRKGLVDSFNEYRSKVFTDAF